jgi:hypothetical protein
MTVILTALNTCEATSNMVVDLVSAGIKGAKLYMLWNDCCNRDMSKVLRAYREYDMTTLKDYIAGDGCRGKVIYPE